MSIKPIISITSVFIACCVNVIVLEELTNNLPGVANLITFLQFAFISLEGFLFTTKCGARKPLVPLTECTLLIVLFFISSVCNNYAYNFNVPTTLHIIIKSGSLVTNMAVGIFVANKQYTKEKYFSIILVTFGIIMCTLSSARNVGDSSSYSSLDILWWSIGIVLLIVALIIGAIMGLLQENLYKKCGKHPQDVLYYTHLLPLPLFMFLYKDLLSAVQLCYNYSPTEISLFGKLSNVWILLFISVLTQYICIRSVYILTSECTSLTVNLVLTLRKFISLLLSVILFQNAFNGTHWFGTFLVFAGTFFYLEIISLKIIFP